MLVAIRVSQLCNYTSYALKTCPTAAQGWSYSYHTYPTHMTPSNVFPWTKSADPSQKLSEAEGKARTGNANYGKQFKEGYVWWSMAEKGLHLQMLMWEDMLWLKVIFFSFCEILGCGWKEAKELMFDIQLLSHFLVFLMHSFWHSTGHNDPPILKIPQDAIFDVYGDEDEDEVHNLRTLSVQHFGRPVSGCRDVELQKGPKREASRSSLGNFQGILGYINLDWWYHSTSMVDG